MSALAIAEAPELPRLLGGLRPDRPVSLVEHLDRHGTIALGSRTPLRALLAASGLQGRGGGGFPVARKLEAVAAGRGPRTVVINATEGEPLSAKDKFLLRRVPHLVLDGAVALAADVAALDVVVAVAAGARNEQKAVAAALAERIVRHFDGPIGVRLVAVPDGFVTGEESALIGYLDGGPARPTLSRPFERGLGGQPTLVQNAETAAHVALIARHGAAWFRELGTREEPGTALFTVSGSVRRPGVHEAAIGTPLRQLVALAGGPADPPQAILVGGYFGTWFGATEAAGLTLDDATLRARGGGLGARAIHVLPASACGAEETALIARYLAAESAGQCGPCVHGLDAIAGALEATLRGRDERERVARWCGQVTGRGACRHPDGAARFVASALDVFAAEFSAHARGRCTRRR